MPETVSTLLVSSWAGLPLWAWAGFLIIVFAVLAADLGLFHRDAHDRASAKALRSPPSACRSVLPFQASSTGSMRPAMPRL